MATTWGFDAYTRTVGQVFNPAVTLIFCGKALYLSLVVAIVPVAPEQLRRAACHRRRRDNIRTAGARVRALLGEVLSRWWATTTGPRGAPYRLPRTAAAPGSPPGDQGAPCCWR